MKVLVTAASKHGSTSEIAGVIGEVLGAAGLEVTVTEPDLVTSLEGFDAAVVGSGVYAGSWLPPARHLVERLSGPLGGIPVWLFSSGPLGDPPRPEPDEAVDAGWAIDATGARDHQVFAGKLDRSTLGFAEKAIMLAVRATDGDYRDWAAIRAWAGAIAGDLSGESG